MKLLSTSALIIFLLIISQSVMANSCVSFQCRVLGDDRIAKTPRSPKYLDAVGKLTVTNTEGTSNICGASLVGLRADQDSRVIVTSFHCLRGERMRWEAHTQSGRTIIRNQLKVLDVSMESDYAILLLDKKVRYQDISPLIVDFELNEYPEDILYDEDYGDPEFVFAGYSADAEFGMSGKVLTYDVTGVISTTDGAYDPVGGSTDGVTTYEGASGGAFIVTYTEDAPDYRTVNFGRQSYLMGVIKGGLSNDFVSSNGVSGSHNTRFVFYYKFMEPLFDALNHYNGPVEGLSQD
ncbi:TPA: hypothetical protein I7120_23070 [Vibrio vulnificus]|nr:hypothetical protein [Vibrio vulnificus]